MAACARAMLADGMAAATPAVALPAIRSTLRMAGLDVAPRPGPHLRAALREAARTAPNPERIPVHGEENHPKQSPKRTHHRKQYSRVGYP